MHSTARIVRVCALRGRACTVLLNRCTLTKDKCNGDRPICKSCRDRNQTCKYESEPGVSPIASLKRKYETLQAESADEHDLLGLLRTATEGDAIKMLAHLRSSDHIQSTLYQARNTLETPPESYRPMASDVHPHRPANQAVSQYGSQNAGLVTAPSIHPELSDSDGITPWALPIEPYVR
jgi:hypothetical protein